MINTSIMNGTGSATSSYSVGNVIPEIGKTFWGVNPADPDQIGFSPLYKTAKINETFFSGVRTWILYSECEFNNEGYPTKVTMHTNFILTKSYYIDTIGNYINLVATYVGITGNRDTTNSGNPRNFYDYKVLTDTMFDYDEAIQRFPESLQSSVGSIRKNELPSKNITLTCTNVPPKASNSPTLDIGFMFVDYYNTIYGGIAGSSFATTVIANGKKGSFGDDEIGSMVIQNSNGYGHIRILE